MSEIALQLIRENKRTQDPFLDLGNCGLRELPRSLFDCIWLKRLNLGKWYFDDDQAFQLRASYRNDENFLLNSALRQLKKLPNLLILDLSYNKISNLHFLEELTNLKGLDISGSIITDYKILEQLPNLENLYLSNNQLSDISFLGNLKNIRCLILSNNNNIKDYSVLNELINLRSLTLSSNHIKDINFIKSLRKLQILNLNKNEIIDIKPIEFLNKLKILILSNNKIEDMGSVLNLLKRREPLTISLDDLDYKYSVDVKEKINLYNNPLTTPPIEIVKQGHGAILNYFAELEKQGQDYLYEAKMLIVGQPRAGKTSLRYKLFDQEADLPEEDKTTRGIDIDRLEFDIVDRDGKPRKFKYNVWDFGGQQIYQSTHQFFLTHRSLYALVMDTGKDSVGSDDSTMNYWLQAVELLGGNSPMLMLLNQKNERPFTVDLGPKRVRFDFLKKEYSVDLNALIQGTTFFKAEQEKVFREFKEDVETELKRLPLVGFPMPKNWVKIREELQQISQKKPYISQQDYILICETHDMVEYEKQRQLSGIFHDLGVFLHFQEHPALEEFIILQNVWATDAVFAVLDNPDVIANHGRFTDADLASIWHPKYDSSVHRKLLELMKQFELCYQVENSSPRTYIIPEMLAMEAPTKYEWQPQNDLPLQYHYDFMPKGILTRFIVRLHRHIARDETKQQLVWKSGVKIDGTTLDCPNTFAEITEAWDNKQLLVRVQGKFPKELMSKLTYEIDVINNDFFKQVSRDTASQKSKWYKMIPCNCQTCREKSDKHYYDYSELLERREFGKNTIECKRKPFETVSINELLDGVFSKQTTRLAENDYIVSGNKNIEKQAKKIFISYSHKDEIEWKDEMVKHMASLQNQDLIDSWTDRQIEPGQWNAQIESAMEEADVFLLLITHNFLASNYISSREITTAYQRYKEGKAMIFPVICDSCAWQWQPVTKMEKEFNEQKNKEMYVWLGKFQAFPKDAQPIKNWPNRQDGFLDVINQLEKYL